MDATTLFQTLPKQGYIVVFILMVIEGPIITSIAAFSASLGLFNVWIIFFLSFLGNLVPDTFLYFLGRFSRYEKIEKRMYRWGLTKQKMKKLEKGFEENAGKTITFVKLVPPFPVPGLILAGFAKVSIKKFYTIDIIFNLVSAVIATSLGFYLGMASVSVFKYLKIGQYAILLLIPLAVLYYIFYKKMRKKISEKIEK